MRKESTNAESLGRLGKQAHGQVGRWADRSGLAGTPSPGPPRLKKAPAAVHHPLPQGGEGIVKDYAEPKKERLVGLS